MQQAHDRPTKRIISSKSNLQLAFDCRIRFKNVVGFEKHVLTAATTVAEIDEYELYCEKFLLSRGRKVKLSCIIITDEVAAVR